MGVENPRIEINLSKIRHNAGVIVDDCREHGVGVAGVTKGVCGMPEVAKAMGSAGVEYIADSRLDNIEKMISAGVKTPMMLLRSPQKHEIERLIDVADVSLQSEIRIIKAINEKAGEIQGGHGIILMIEMGDLREGIMYRNWRRYCREIERMDNIRLLGLGANFACASGVNPTPEKMRDFAGIVGKAENYLGRPLEIVSGGSSVNLHLMYEGGLTDSVNQLRIGEAILLGADRVGGEYEEKVYQDAFKLYCEIIELKQKAARPSEKTDKKYHAKDTPDRIIERAIIALGRQDAMIKRLDPADHDVELLTSSSDHTVLDVTGQDYGVWDEVEFNLDYENMLNLITSEYVYKKFVK